MAADVQPATGPSDALELQRGSAGDGSALSPSGMKEQAAGVLLTPSGSGAASTAILTDEQASNVPAPVVTASAPSPAGKDGSSSGNADDALSMQPSSPLRAKPSLSLAAVVTNPSPETFDEISADVLSDDPPTVVHMKSIPEDLTQREPAPPVPTHWQGDSGAPAQHYHVQLADKPPMPGSMGSITEGDDEEEAAEDGGGRSNGTGRTDASMLSNASTIKSAELTLGRSTSEEEALELMKRNRQQAAGTVAAPATRAQRVVHPAVSGPQGVGRTGEQRVHLPTPRPNESLASRMAQQRRQRMAQRAQVRQRIHEDTPRPA